MDVSLTYMQCLQQQRQKPSKAFESVYVTVSAQSKQNDSRHWLYCRAVCFPHSHTQTSTHTISSVIHHHHQDIAYRPYNSNVRSRYQQNLIKKKNNKKKRERKTNQLAAQHSFVYFAYLCASIYTIFLVQYRVIRIILCFVNTIVPTPSGTQYLCS